MPGSDDIGGLLRWTLGAALAWGGTFLAVAASGAVVVGVDPTAHPGPIGAFAAIGFTVGGLTGPLLRGVVRRIGLWSRTDAS